MTQQNIAGWYGDPQAPNSQHHRYWDGRAWTELTSDNLSDIERGGTAGLPTGRYAWALGFLAWIPIPFRGLIIGAVAMAVTYRTARLKGSALCTENARRAANWGLTVLVGAVLCVVYFVVVVNTVPNATEGGFFPVGGAVIAYIVLVVVHSIVTIAGTMAAAQGKVFNPRIAIPFVRG